MAEPEAIGVDDIALTVVGDLANVSVAVGNAVPSLLAEVLAWEIRRQLLGTRRKPDQLKLMPLQRGTPPSPESVSRVPPKYRSLIGDHADHPGEGLGKGARQRIFAVA